MRLIMLDTETTGLSPLNGDRMVEIGAVEVCHRSIQEGRSFHRYINPGRPIPEEVVRIHGISDDDVKNEPPFDEIAPSFLEFVDGATLVIHNAGFDLGFIANELRLGGFDDIGHMSVIDTLDLARHRHPHQRNNLDALCDRYGVDRSRRTRHGALLDAELLAEVYLAMTGGRQFSLDTDVHIQTVSNFVRLPETQSGRDEKVETAAMMRRPPPPVDEQEMEAHQLLLERIHQESGQAIWLLPPQQA
ncbi:MAG TPA: DNA polymerase III subunit epsilon [Mariprofundaceae bacterium]|nr:DNA polymerase III subunit epsilon [Mariprofundaceae bacterium]